MADNVPRVMRVATFYSWGDVRVEEAPVPQPGHGEVLIRVDACGLCGSDALEWYVAKKAPVVLGHEPAGTIVEVGPGVDEFHPGDRVFVHHHAPCGECAECQRRLWSNCATWRSSRLRPGGFSEYVVAPAIIVARDMLRLPRDMSAETGTFVEPLACCLRAVRTHGRLQAGETLHVVGLGAMGLLIVQLGRTLGAGRIVGSDFIDERRRHARMMGASVTLDPGDHADRDGASDGGRGSDVVIVCPGDARAIAAGIAHAAPGGRIVCFTPMPPGTPLTLDQSALYFREIALSQSYSCGPDETRMSLDLLARGDIVVDSLVTHRGGLEDIAGALDRVRDKVGLKTIIHPGR